MNDDEMPDYMRRDMEREIYREIDREDAEEFNGPSADNGYRCFNCIDLVYMTDLGDGMFRCPVCGDEYDETYEDSEADR